VSSTRVINNCGRRPGQNKQEPIESRLGGCSINRALNAIKHVVGHGRGGENLDASTLRLSEEDLGR